MARAKQRGIALITAIMLTGLIAAMIGAVLISVHGESFTTLGYQDRVKAHYAAEAGLTACLEALRDRSWTAGFSQQPLASGRESFSVTFDTSGSPGAEDSVNNLLGTTAVDGPKGPQTVPPGCAYLVIEGRSGLSVERLEVVVRNGPFPNLEMAVLADDTIEFYGDVAINGIDTLAQGNAVPGGVHSNSQASGTDLVSWYGTGNATFDGTVSVAGPQAGIHLPGATLNGSPPVQGGANERPFPHIDIATEVAAKASAPTVTVPASGDLVVGSGTPGDFHINGNTTIDGDLVLDGGTLYIEGDLTVLGTISGDGGVYVNGETTFYGDAQVTTNNQHKVAVYSSGDLNLRGFNGTEYIESKTLQTLWTRTGNAVTDLKTNLAANNLNQVDKIRASLGEEYFPGGSPGPLYQPPGTSAWSTHGHDLFRHLADHLETNYPADPTRDFLIERFKEQEYFFHNSDIDVDRTMFPLSSHGWPNEITMQDWHDRTGHPGGPFDQMLDLANPLNPRYAGPGAAPNLTEMSTVVDQIEADRLGSAYFQGLVYTTGDLNVEHELHVMGAVMAEGGLGNGTMVLNNGSHITFIEEYFDPRLPTTAGGPPQVIARFSR